MAGRKLTEEKKENKKKNKKQERKHQGLQEVEKASKEKVRLVNQRQKQKSLDLKERLQQ